MMISPSVKAKLAHNPIRQLVDSFQPPKNHDKKHLNLSLGDPTVHGNLSCPPAICEAIPDLLARSNVNGYLPSIGLPSARNAIAEYSCKDGGDDVSGDQVIITSGCSGALELTLSALINAGDNILIPKPGFPLYQTIVESLGGAVKHYPLLPDNDWECDLQAMASLVDDRTRAILINNPSNPCGSNFSIQHLQDICTVARKFGLPIISDEIYGGLVFDGKFAPMHIHSGDVPVITVSGIGKEFVVPGWRLGWLVLHDKGTGRLRDLGIGMRNLTQLLLGANSLMQHILPRILCPQKNCDDAMASALQEFGDHYKGVLRGNADLLTTVFVDTPALSASKPAGALYAMIGINLSHLNPLEISSDEDFAKLLLQEENMFVFPMHFFGLKNYLRIVISCPEEVLMDACNRLKDFCKRHAK